MTSTYDKHSNEREMIIFAQNLSKIYNNGHETIALNEVTLKIMRREFIAIYGSSGSGKSTLLHLLAGLDRPTKPTTASRLEINGISLIDRSESFLSNFRAHHIGFVLQFFGLLPTLTAIENVMIASYFAGSKRRERKKIAEKALKAVGLSDRLYYYPSQLSGGQKQRVAIARALVNNPLIIFADEPTGNLDTKSGKEVLELLKKLNDCGLTVVMVTHDPTVFNYTTRCVELSDGSIVNDRLINLASNER
ncbi:MAG: ABC transporter ATP-binding protein [Candidatus Hodarchaeales archaeon]|jgi:putative ABC transport system ATP-binding protein